MNRINVGLFAVALAASACGESTTKIPEDAGSGRVPDGATSDPRESCDGTESSRIAPCGFCGMRSERCQDGLWTPVSTCLDQGECEAGAVQTEGSEACGRRQRLCLDVCSWSDWSVIEEPAGSCTEGETRRTGDGCPSGMKRAETCSATCDWVSDGPCLDDCGGAERRTIPADAEEICIPGGKFVRGTEDRPAAQPIAEVFVSPFYIDRYPATNNRYQACIDDGACTVPERENGRESLEDPRRASHPVQGLSWEQASEFCEWDGRRLPTEAEWEKAARGPAPRDNDFPWGDDYDCDVMPSAYCGEPLTDFHRKYFPDRYDAFPGAESYYGVALMLGGGLDWTRDFFLVDYYESPDSLEDPQGPSESDFGRSVRGSTRRAASPTLSLADRGGRSSARWESTVRCARDPGM